MDIAGLERFRSHVRDYFHATDFYVIMYSVTDRASFEVGVQDWLEELRRYDFCGRQPRVLLLGNKCDRVVIVKRKSSYLVIRQNQTLNACICL